MNQTKTTLITALALSVTATALAGPTTTTNLSQPVEKSAWEELWSLATLYKDDANPILEEFKLRGRYQGQSHWLNSAQGDDTDWENRRSRFGFDAKLFGKQIELRLDAQSTDTFDPFYDRLVDAYLRWKPSSAFSLTLGKQKPQIGYYDWLQSTNAQPTFERSQIFNQLKVDRTTGAVAEGKVGNYTWQGGIYTNEIDREFGKFGDGYSFGAGVGYDFKDALGLAKADWRVDWLHSQHGAEDTVLNRYDDLISTTLWLQDGRWSLVGEAFLGTGTAPTALGFYIQPTYDLVPQKLQLVGRYSLATGEGAGSLSAQKRYEATAPALTGGGKGGQYQAAYLGLQYFLHGDKLKFLAGAEYARLAGSYDGWTILTGVRVSF